MTPRALSLKQYANKKKAGKKTLNIFLAGVGAVGGTLLNQIAAINHHGTSLHLLGICNKEKVKWRANSESISELSDKLYRGESKNWDSIMQTLAMHSDQNLVFVDATGSQEVAGLYERILKSGIHIVTPSKLAITKSQLCFDTLLDAAGINGVQYQFETTVGAGLPVIEPIRNLIESGDEIVEISGVLSGTMTYLFHELEKGALFSEAVLRARALGYAEPDPRDDLSGEDVARKFLILARTCGQKMERNQILVESLIPDFLQDADPTTFLKDLNQADACWKERLDTCQKTNHTLRYTGTYSGDSVRIGIQEVDKNSPIGQLTGTNNLIRIKTRRYFDQPLIIQGPGAGKEVTAAGVLNDILKVQNS
ncbi:MAG: hypothetical protein ACFCU6_11965 [Balneolaceae bacterium]